MIKATCLFYPRGRRWTGEALFDVNCVVLCTILDLEIFTKSNIYIVEDE